MSYRRSSQLYLTVGPQDAHFPITGNNGHLALQAAFDAAETAGGATVVVQGTCNVGAISKVRASNIAVVGDKGATIRATQSVFGGWAPNAALGMLTIEAQTSELKNTVIEDIQFDCNNLDRTQAVGISGGDPSGGSISGVTMDRCTLKNMGVDDNEPSRALLQINSGRGFHGDFGNVSDVTIRRCPFRDTKNHHIYILGQNVHNLLVDDCDFRKARGSSVAWYQYSKASNTNSSYRSHRNWKFQKNYWTENYLKSYAGTMAALDDLNRTGVIGLKVHDNRFKGRSGNIDEIAINTHGSWIVDIAENFFDGVRNCISLGESYAGSAYNTNPSFMARVRYNTFFRTLMVADYDACIFAKWEGNDFYEVETMGISPYSRHWPQTYRDNTFYNCPTRWDGADDIHKCILITGVGADCTDNTIIDDRLLPNPTTAPTLSQVVGGSLGARTYYVKYTFQNDTGETLASSQASLAVSANNLLKVTVPTGTDGIPTGTKRIYVYASTTSGAETRQDYIPIAWHLEAETDHALNWAEFSWTEPTTGLVSGAALPGSNTTHTMTKFGFYELEGGGGVLYANTYLRNKFYGIETPIRTHSSYTRIRKDNLSNPTLTTGADVLLEEAPYAQGNVTGATTFNIGNGTTITATLTGNITVTLSSGEYKGQTLTLKLTQDGTGTRTASWPATFKKAGGTLTLSTGAGATDVITAQWDGTNWVEVSRALNVS